MALLHAAGVPASALHLLPGDGRVGASLVADARTAGVCFTGSSSVGKQIAQLAAGKKLLLELGGNGPVIVLKDADLPRTVDGFDEVQWLVIDDGSTDETVAVAREHGVDSRCIDVLQQPLDQPHRTRR